MKLFILPIREAELITDEYCNANFPERMKRAERFRFKEDRLRCIGAGALLCGMLGIKEADIIYNEYGKPTSAVRTPQFSISHSGEYVILATSDGPVGADIEDMSRKHMEIAKRVFLPEEIAWMDEHGEGDAEERIADVQSVESERNEQSERNRRFFVLWTLKESIMKAEGQGLSMDPASFSVLPIVKGGKCEIDGRTYFGKSFEHDGYIISVCSRSDEPVERINIKAEML